MMLVCDFRGGRGIVSRVRTATSIRLAASSGLICEFSRQHRQQERHRKRLSNREQWTVQMAKKAAIAMSDSNTLISDKRYGHHTISSILGDDSSWFAFK